MVRRLLLCFYVLGWTCFVSNAFSRTAPCSSTLLRIRRVQGPNQQTLLSLSSSKEQHDDDMVRNATIDKSNSLLLLDENDDDETSTTTAPSRFGESVPLTQRPRSSNAPTEDASLLVAAMTTTSTDTAPTADAAIEASQRRNLWAAVVSVALAVTTYLYQFTHPVQPVQLLYTMQQNSQSMSVIGVNDKPTVVDFWAPVRRCCC